MNWRELPLLAAVRAFADFVETGSVAEVGTALSVSHAAVRQQLRNLETHLGVAFRDPTPELVCLTPGGVDLPVQFGTAH